MEACPSGGTRIPRSWGRGRGFDSRRKRARLGERRMQFRKSCNKRRTSENARDARDALWPLGLWLCGLSGLFWGCLDLVHERLEIQSRAELPVLCSWRIDHSRRAPALGPSAVSVVNLMDLFRHRSSRMPKPVFFQFMPGQPTSAVDS